jgi:hypothetical protein
MTETSVIVAAHRAVADLLEQHPDLARPHVYGDGVVVWRLYSFECPDGVPAMVAAIRRAVGGTWDKREETDYLGDHMIFERDGYRVSTPERTETREVIEWDCQPILGEPVSA